MKKSFLKRAAVFFTSAVLVFTASFAAYADDALTVNGESVKKGDTVTFEYYMSGVKDPLEAAGATIEYDPSCLEYIDGSIGFDVFRNAMYNAAENGIYYSAIDVIDGFDFTDEKLVVKASFKVLDSAKGDMTITNSFKEIFTIVNEDVDLTENDYKGRTVTTVSAAYSGNDAPNVGIDANKLEELQRSSETDFDKMMLGTDKDEAVSKQNETTSQSKPDTSSDAAVSSDEKTSSSAASSAASSKTTSADSSAASSSVDSSKEGDTTSEAESESFDSEELMPGYGVTTETAEEDGTSAAPDTAESTSQPESKAPIAAIVVVVVLILAACGAVVVVKSKKSSGEEGK